MIFNRWFGCGILVSALTLCCTAAEYVAPKKEVVPKIDPAARLRTITCRATQHGKFLKVIRTTPKA